MGCKGCPYYKVGKDGLQALNPKQCMYCSGDDDTWDDPDYPGPQENEDVNGYF
jgi:hypothetical protein